jgi:hypothetical protein
VNLLKNKEWLLVTILMAVWAGFAADFISRTTHVSIDGVRYFAIFDDGMIGMRYAKNLVEHHALVWNVGDRVEGITDPLWVVFMAGAIWLFGTHFAPLAMQILGGLICLTLFVMFYRSAMGNKTGFLAAITGLLFLAASYPVSYWGLAGMEACAICLIYAIAVSAQYSYEKGFAENPLLLHSILIAIAYCFRPDAWLAIAPFFGACWFDGVKEKSYRRALMAMVIPVAVGLGVLLARVAYYGEWVPNTYVLKMQGYSLALRLKNGFAFVRPFCYENLGALGLIALAAVSKKRIVCLNGLAAGTVLAYQVYVGGDPWPYWRQLLPIYVAAAFAILILFEHLDGLAEKTKSEGQRLKPPAIALGIAMALLPVALFEYYVFSLHGGIDSVDRKPLLIIYLVAASALVLLSTYKATNSPVQKNLIRITLARVIIVIVAAYSLLMGDIRFRFEFGESKPFLFDAGAESIDKAVLANRLFGAGKTHHVVLAGTYPYYVEGTMIDALGKSDKRIARYPVDEAVSWEGMRGVPGHAKYDFRESLLQRKPDIVTDFASWGRQDVSPEMKGSYVLIESERVRLCVRKELSVDLEPLVRGNCPSKFF